MKKTKLGIAAAVIATAAVTTAYVLPTSAQASPSPDSTPAASVAATETSYTPPPITWSACTNGLQAYGAQCGFLTVPLDYAHPKGAKIKLAVSRISHTSDAADYQGAIVVNLSLAGNSTLTQSAFGQALPASINSQYDWIGFDTRGVGSSEPTLSCDPTFYAYDRPAYLPASQKQLTAWENLTESYSSDCAKTHSELLDHLTTADSAQDMDALRKALGQKQISYYGYLWGAYLGEVYSSLYPSRVHRMILDSAVDPSQIWTGYNYGQNAPLNQNLSAFSAWAAQYNGTYHLGATAADVEKQYYAVLAQLTKKPTAGGLGPDVWTDDFLLAYNTGNWENLAGVFSAYVNAGDDGPMKELFDGSYSTTDDNAFAVSLATECTDSAWPKSWGPYVGATEKSYTQAPFASWADTWFIASCESWKAPAQKPVRVGGGAKSPSILMVLDTTIDPSTTLAGSLDVRKLFPNAVLVQSGATPASTATADSCSPGTSIAEYLAAGILPTRVAGDTVDLGCPANALPDPTTDAANATAKPALAAGPAGL